MGNVGKHIDRDRQALKEILVVLKPGGVLVLSTTNGATLPVPSKYHMRHYKPADLKIMMEGFFNLKLLWCLFPKGRFWRESIKSVKSMLQNREIISIIKHVAMEWIYWVFTGY